MIIWFLGFTFSHRTTIKREKGVRWIKGVNPLRTGGSFFDHRFFRKEQSVYFILNYWIYEIIKVMINYICYLIVFCFFLLSYGFFSNIPSYCCWDAMSSQLLFSPLIFYYLRIFSLTNLNYMLTMVKSLCIVRKRINCRRFPCENNYQLASPNTVLIFDNEGHLPVKGKRRWAYWNTKETNYRSNIECFTCKLPLCLKVG